MVMVCGKWLMVKFEFSYLQDGRPQIMKSYETHKEETIKFTRSKPFCLYNK